MDRSTGVSPANRRSTGVSPVIVHGQDAHATGRHGQDGRATNRRRHFSSSTGEPKAHHHLCVLTHGLGWDKPRIELELVRKHRRAGRHFRDSDNHQLAPKVRVQIERVRTRRRMVRRCRVHVSTTRILRGDGASDRRQEPGAVVPLVGLCAGAAGQPMVLAATVFFASGLRQPIFLPDAEICCKLLPIGEVAAVCRQVSAKIVGQGSR